jgi:hypothetical protein
MAAVGGVTRAEPTIACSLPQIAATGEAGDTILLKAGMAAASTIAIGISAQIISVALPDRDADGGGPSWSGLAKVTMEPIIAANTATAIAAHSQTVISRPFTGRTPPSA